MSTFTRLYFTNRGPNIADCDSQNASAATDEGFVSPETTPLDPDPDGLRELALAKLAVLPDLPEVLRLQRGPALSHDEGWPDDRNVARR